MPVIRFSESDYLATTKVEVGVYPTEILSVDGPKKSKSGNSLNYIVEFRIIDGRYSGKTHTIVYNDATSSPSVLGDRQFMPLNYMLMLFKATGLDDGKVKSTDFDTDDLIHGQLDTSWAISTSDGLLINTITGFHPRGESEKHSEGPGF